MKALLQRVTRASVSVGDEVVGSIGQGLVALVGVAGGDTQADARYRDALAQHLNRNESNWIVDVTPDGKRNTLTFILKFPLAAGKWDFMLDGEKKCEVPPEQLGNHAITLIWDTKQKWLDDGLMERSLELHDSDKGVTLRRV